MAITMQQVDALKTLNAFKDFAQTTGTADSIVHYEQAAGFSVDTRDRIRGFLTWTSPHRNVDANNATRDTFKESLLALFNKHELSELPTSVKNALKAGDFDGSGKPLSVRRIQAIMTAVVDTVEYMNTTEYAAMKSFAATKLDLNIDPSEFLAFQDRTGPKAGDSKIISNMIQFCEGLNFRKADGQNEGGHFNEVIGTIGKDLNTKSLKSEVADFFAGIKMSLMHQLTSPYCQTGDFSFRTDHVIGQGMYSNLPMMERIEVKSTGNAIQDLDDFFDAFKNYAEAKFRLDNQNADPAAVKAAINKVMEEVKALVDQLKVRMAGLERLDELPGANAPEKVKNFITIHENIDTVNQMPGKDFAEKAKNYVCIIKAMTIAQRGISEERKLSHEQMNANAIEAAPKLFFKFDPSKKEVAKTELKNFLTAGFVKEKTGLNRMNPVTGVNAQMVREANGKPITINGAKVPEDEKDIPDLKVSIPGVKDEELTASVWKNDGCGASQASKPGVWVHQSLCQAIPDRRMREFVSVTMSMSLGVKNFFDDQLEKNGLPGDTLKLFGDEPVGTLAVAGYGLPAIPIEGHTIADGYEIKTNDQGDVQLTAKFATGVQYVPGMGIDGDEMVLSKNEFTVVINFKNEFDEQGIPKMEIQTLEVE